MQWVLALVPTTFLARVRQAEEGGASI